MNKPIPTCRTMPRALTIIALVVLALVSGWALSGCGQTTTETQGTFGLKVFIDSGTGCQYVAVGSTIDGHSVTPRMDRDGKQICK